MFKGAGVIHPSEGRCLFKQEKNEAGKTTSIAESLSIKKIQSEILFLVSDRNGIANPPDNVGRIDSVAP
jgi:hypothetical protein